MKTAKARKIREAPLTNSRDDWPLKFGHDQGGFFSSSQRDPLQEKVRGAFHTCLNQTEQAVLTMRYRLNEFDLPISPESNMQPSLPLQTSSRLPSGRRNNKHTLSRDVMKKLARMNPEGCLRPHDEVALVCGMPFDLVQTTEIQALRKLMRYGHNVE